MVSRRAPGGRGIAGSRPRLAGSMTLPRLLAVYVLTLAAFLALDAVWLGLVARGLYRRELGHLLAPEVRWGAALLFYLLYTAGLLVLVVIPHRGGPLPTAALLGGVFGLCAYAAYDLTNLATIARWPVTVTVADLVWGTAVTAASAACGLLAARWLLR